MQASTFRVLLVAAVGLAIAGGLSWLVASSTRETSLLSGASPEAGLRLAPGNELATSIPKPGDKPVVVKIGADGKAVVQSRGTAPLIQDVSGSGAVFTRNSRNQDD